MIDHAEACTPNKKNKKRLKLEIYKKCCMKVIKSRSNSEKHTWIEVQDLFKIICNTENKKLIRK